MLLDPILCAYRTSIQSSSKFAHFFLMYGRRARLPVEIAGEQSSGDHSGDETNDSTAWYVMLTVSKLNSLIISYFFYSCDFDSHVTKMLEFTPKSLLRPRATSRKPSTIKLKKQYDRKHAGPTGITTGSIALTQMPRTNESPTLLLTQRKAQPSS